MDVNRSQTFLTLPFGAASRSHFHSLKPSQPVGLGMSHLTTQRPSPWPARLLESRKQTASQAWRCVVAAPCSGQEAPRFRVGSGVCLVRSELPLSLVPVASEPAMLVSGGGAVDGQQTECSTKGHRGGRCWHLFLEHRQRHLRSHRCADSLFVEHSGLMHWYWAQSFILYFGFFH